MKDLLRYLFRPSKNNPDAVRSAYYGSLKPTHVMLWISFIMCVIFMVLTFTTPSFFGPTVFYHRIIYIVLFIVALLWMALARYAVQDYQSRYRIIYVMNALMGSLMYAWAIALAFVNLVMRAELDTTIFMTVSLIFPLSVYLSPITYLLIALASNAFLCGTVIRTGKHHCRIRQLHSLLGIPDRNGRNNALHKIPSTRAARNSSKTAQ